MDGPLIDDWQVGITLSPPMYSGGGMVVVIRWNEPGPFPDQRRVYEVWPALDGEAILIYVAELIEAYLISRASGIRRVIARLERAGTLRL